MLTKMIWSTFSPKIAIYKQKGYPESFPKTMGEITDILLRFSKRYWNKFSTSFKM